MFKRMAIKEYPVYLEQYFRFIKSENFLKLLIFPILALIINAVIAGEYTYQAFNDTEIICFVVICEAIWCGLFRSILNIVKERNNIKRDVTAGTRVRTYVLSRAMIEFLICMVQSLFFALSFWVTSLTVDGKFVERGLVFKNPMMDLYITMLLVTYSADMLGLMISCIAKTEIKASQLAPYVLMCELVLSGSLFDLEGIGKFFSKFMVSRWGTEAVGAIFNISTLSYFPSGYEALDFTHSKGHLVGIWWILILFCIAQIVLGNILLKKGLKKHRI